VLWRLPLLQQSSSTAMLIGSIVGADAGADAVLRDECW
jgi:hypothetical protein